MIWLVGGGIEAQGVEMLGEVARNELTYHVVEGETYFMDQEY